MPNVVDKQLEISQSYMGTVEQLLGVWRQTPEDICLVESAIPSVQSLMLKQQRCFLQKIISRVDFRLTSLRKALDLAISTKSPMGVF